MKRTTYQRQDFALDKDFSAPILARIFSPKVIDELASEGASPLLGKILKEAGAHLDGSTLLADVYNHSYKAIEKHYKNEYIYKNNIANKVLLGKHSLNTAAMLTELRIYESKADAVVLNGTSHVYEIKTELDSLDRLPKQLNDYSLFADYIHVITTRSYIDNVLDLIPQHVGVIELTNRGTFREVRSSTSNKENCSPKVIFDSLRKDEYCKIISSFFGDVPDLPNTQMYKACLELFEKIPAGIAHDLMVKVLKISRTSEHQKNLIKDVPKSLKAVAVSSNLSKAQAIRLAQALRGRYRIA